MLILQGNSIIEGLSEKSYALFAYAFGTMGLLDELFPGLAGYNGEGVPVWDEHATPWSILSGEGDLVAQIERIGASDDIFIHPSATIGECVMIEGPCYIGEDVEVRHSAFLRKGSWICQGAVVGHSSEVKNSILLPGSKAPHFNYVGDSILGFDVNLGAGTKLSNIRNDRREVLITLGDGKRVETGLVKFGAIIGDGSQLGCNVVTNPGTIMQPLSMVSPNETITGWFGVK